MSSEFDYSKNSDLKKEMLETDQTSSELIKKTYGEINKEKYSIEYSTDIYEEFEEIVKLIDKFTRKKNEESSTSL